MRARSAGFWLRLIAALLMLAAALAFAGWHWLQGWTPSRALYPVQGIAVSAAQGDIDWGSVRAADADFAYIAATDGDARRDPAFARNWDGVRRAGMRYGAELRFDPCASATAQATLFITTVPRDNAALPPSVALDLPPDCTGPPTADHVLSELNTLINVVETHAGVPAILHISPAFEDRYHVAAKLNRTLWLDRGFWEPGYAGRSWVMWTASAMHHVEGVPAPVGWTVVAP